MSFTFNGVNCESLGMFVEHYPNRMAARRKRTFIAIPGRSGDLTETQDAYENVTVQYDVFIKAGEDFSETIRLIAQWLLFPRSYAVLQDTYTPGYYREAIFEGPLNIEDELHSFGRATLTFNAKPQLFSDKYRDHVEVAATGENLDIILYDLWDPFYAGGLYFDSVNSRATIRNPTRFKTRPNLVLIGTPGTDNSGSISIGNYVINVPQVPNLTRIDCLSENIVAEEGVSAPFNANSLFDSGVFFELPGGDTRIEVSGNIKMIIDPRWWTI